MLERKRKRKREKKERKRKIDTIKTDRLYERGKINNLSLWEATEHMPSLWRSVIDSILSRNFRSIVSHWWYFIHFTSPFFTQIYLHKFLIINKINKKCTEIFILIYRYTKGYTKDYSSSLSVWLIRSILIRSWNILRDRF